MELIITTPDQLQTAIEQAVSKAFANIPTGEPKAEDAYLTPEDVARLLKISEVTLWNWDKAGITKPLRIGNLKRYRRSELDAVFESISAIRGNKRGPKNGGRNGKK